jgi:hypothetical protein
VSQVVVDPETFKGIHHRLAELGGVVVDAVEKMREAYFACKDVPYHCQPGTHTSSTYLFCQTVLWKLFAKGGTAELRTLDA